MSKNLLEQLRQMTVVVADTGARTIASNDCCGCRYGGYPSD